MEDKNLEGRTKKIPQYGGYLVEVDKTLRTINEYLAMMGDRIPQAKDTTYQEVQQFLQQLGDCEPAAITLYPYQWALLDMSFRSGSGGVVNLHTHVYRGVRILCYAGLCYCHAVPDPEIRAVIDRVLRNTDTTKGIFPAITPEDRERLDRWFDFLFDGALTLDSDPILAFRVLYFAGMVRRSASNNPPHPPEGRGIEGSGADTHPESPPVEQRNEEHRVDASVTRDSGSVQTISVPEVGWLKKMAERRPFTMKYLRRRPVKLSRKDFGQLPESIITHLCGPPKRPLSERLFGKGLYDIVADLYWTFAIWFIAISIPVILWMEGLYGLALLYILVAWEIHKRN